MHGICQQDSDLRPGRIRALFRAAGFRPAIRPILTMSRLHSGLSLFASACLALAGCAAPKATVVEEPKPKKAAQTTAEAPAATKLPDSGMRIGNMTELPKDSEFRATNPGAAKSEPGGSAVIVSPTAKPPADGSKPAPKD